MSYKKYYLYKEQVSHDGGITWQDTGNQAPSGSPIGSYETYEQCTGGTPPTPTATTFEINVSVTNSTSQHIEFTAFQLVYINSQGDSVQFTGAGLEIDSGQTVTQTGITLQQGHEGNTIDFIAVAYKLGGVNQQRSLNSDEWSCTSGEQLGQGDTLYINFKS